MNWVRRDGFVTALREGILWYCTAQQEHSPEAAELLAQRFADAVGSHPRQDRPTAHFRSGMAASPGLSVCIGQKAL